MRVTVSFHLCVKHCYVNLFCDPKEDTQINFILHSLHAILSSFSVAASLL